MDFKKLEEEFKTVGCDNMAIFFDWLSHYYTSTNAESEQENYNKVYGFLWGMSVCGKISAEFRNSLIDQIIDDMKY